MKIHRTRRDCRQRGEREFAWVGERETGKEKDDGERVTHPKRKPAISQGDKGTSNVVYKAARVSPGMDVTVGWIYSDYTGKFRP